MIFYFSCTGNTRWAAHTLATVLGERLIFMNEASMKDSPYSLEPGERIGFCFPVHGWRPPVAVRRYVRHLEVAHAEGHHCWALCTAGDTVGEAMDLMCADLAARGLTVSSTYSLLMPESYVGLPFMDVDKPEKERAKIDAAAKALESFGALIARRAEGEHHIVRGRWPRVNSRLIGHVFVKRLLTDKPFHVVEDRCERCGRCAKACPTGAVTCEKGGIPRWSHDGRCLSCFACYHHCPHHAIEYGNRTKKKGQYYFSEGRRKAGC